LASPIRSASSAPDQPPGHDQLLRPPEPDDLRQPRAAADVRDEADRRLRQPDHRVRREHAEVARQRELERPADARALDRADHGLGHLLGEAPCLDARPPERAQPLRRLRQPGERAEVHAGGEARARPAQHDAAHGRVVGGRPQRRAGGEHQLGVERVALVGAVEHDVTNGAVVF
jgi:hypothetical protein